MHARLACQPFVHLHLFLPHVIVVNFDQMVLGAFGFGPA